MGKFGKLIMGTAPPFRIIGITNDSLSLLLVQDIHVIIYKESVHIYLEDTHLISFSIEVSKSRK